MSSHVKCPPARKRNRARVPGSLRAIAESSGVPKSTLHETLEHLVAVDAHPELATMKKKRAIRTARRLRRRGKNQNTPAHEANTRGVAMFGRNKPALIRLEMVGILAGMTTEEIERDRELQAAIAGLYNDAPLYDRGRVEELISKRERSGSDVAA